MCSPAGSRRAFEARRPADRRVVLAGCVLLLALASCRPPASAPSAPVSPAGQKGRKGHAVTAALATLADDFWHAHLDADPIEATLLGYHGYDDRMPDHSPEARTEELRKLTAFRARLGAQAPESALAPADRVTRALLAGEIEGDLAIAGCHMEEWVVDPRDGPPVAYLDLAGLQPVKTPADRAALLARWSAMSRALDQRIANLRRGLAAGKTSARSEVERVVRQLDELLAQPDEKWPLAAPPQRVPDGTWSAEERRRFQVDLEGVIASGLRPAFSRYRALLRDYILGRARGDADVGIGHLAGGDACYRALVKVHTSLTLDPAVVHQIGLDELARIRGEMEALGPAAVGSGTFAAIQAKLRGHDPTLFYRTREEIEADAGATLARATAAMPRFLGRLPRTPCVVKPIEPHEEKDSPIAYYRQPAIDGTRPGAYYVNTYQPETRPRFEAEALAFHESIPGHHVQIALAQELRDVPEFRKHLGVTAFVEGWGLYAERLSDELGLYSGPLTRLGRLSLEAWRAARLVVDTGIHALGWSRARAVQFLTENTLIAGNNIENEVDRYIGWPGQALAYKTGEREIVRLREKARRALGPAFDLRAFHDVVLGNGAVTLPVLSAAIDGWIAARAH